MGTTLARPQICPERASLSLSSAEPSRASFTFLQPLMSSGVSDQSIWWLAADASDPQATYFVRQISKAKVYNHKRVPAVLEEMRLLTESNNNNIIKVFSAFQDSEFLYLVTESFDWVPFTQLLAESTFQEEETRYVASALLHILAYVHEKGYAITNLSPSSIIFDKKSGQLKLVEITNPVKIDSYYRSNAVLPVCPYSAPEILYRGQVLAECDFYSIGLIVYQMMTQEKVFQGQLDRNSILKENLEVEKSKIPQQWEPEVADFLIKILVKNPSLRLGRYGCFEVKNHTWLKEFDLEDHYKNRLYLDQYQKTGKKDENCEKVKELQSGLSNQLTKDYFFQEVFQGYLFNRLQIEEGSNGHESGLEKTTILFNESNVKLQESYF